MKFGIDAKVAVNFRQENVLLALPEKLFLCPITQKRLVNPVITPEGNVYSKTAIEGWLKDHKTDPITGNNLTRAQLANDKFTKNLLDTSRLIHDKQHQLILLLDRTKLQYGNGNYYDNPINDPQGRIKEGNAAAVHPHKLAKKLIAIAKKVERVERNPFALDEAEGAGPADHKIDVAAPANEPAPHADLAAARAAWQVQNAEAKDAKHDAVLMIAFPASDFDCPIATPKLLDGSAVITPSGFYYNRVGIENWLTQKESDPQTRTSVKKEQLRNSAFPHTLVNGAPHARTESGELLVVIHRDALLNPATGQLYKNPIVNSEGAVIEAADDKSANVPYRNLLLNSLTDAFAPGYRPKQQAADAKAIAAAAAVDAKHRNDEAERARPPRAAEEPEALIDPLAAAGYGAVDIQPLLAAGDNDQEGQPAPAGFQPVQPPRGPAGELAMEANDAYRLQNDLELARRAYREAEKRRRAAEARLENAEELATRRGNVANALCFILVGGGAGVLIWQGMTLILKKLSHNNDGPTPPGTNSTTLSYPTSVIEATLPHTTEDGAKPAKLPDAKQSTATAKPAMKPQTLATDDKANPLTEAPTAFQDALTDAVSKGVLQSFLLTMQGDTLVKFLKGRGYKDNEILWINQIMTTVTLLAIGTPAITTAATVAVSAALTKGLNLDNKIANRISSGLLAMTHVFNSSLGITKTLALFGVNFAMNTITSIATSNAIKPVISGAVKVLNTLADSRAGKYAYSAVYGVAGMFSRSKPVAKQATVAMPVPPIPPVKLTVG